MKTQISKPTAVLVVACTLLAGLIRAPISGEFMCVKVVATGAVTPPVKATLL